jgi:hypothetical protein
MEFQQGIIFGTSHGLEQANVIPGGGLLLGMGVARGAGEFHEDLQRPANQGLGLGQPIVGPALYPAGEKALAARNGVVLSLLAVGIETLCPSF